MGTKVFDILPIGTKFCVYAIPESNYPGNIRELENVIEYATVVCKNGLIGVEHLPEYLKPGLDTGEAPAKGGAKGLSWDRVEKSFIYEALRRNQWNRTVTAEQLGIHPTTLWRKMKRLKMEVPE